MKKEDLRTRFESDWNSSRSSGSDRDDRGRMRIRARVGLRYQSSDNLTWEVRARTGSDYSHQSPHITLVDFDNNDTGNTDFNFDKYYFRYDSGDSSTWVGKNSLPFWKQNELFWDDDITPMGLGYNYSSNGVQFNAGYFSLPVGMKEASGELGLAQVVYSGSTGEAGFDLAAGLLSFDANKSDSDGDMLLDGNGGRDYDLWILSARSIFNGGAKPIEIGLDYMVNSEDYSAADPNAFTAFNRDKDTGYVAAIKYGQTSNIGDWRIEYYYADIETFAVNSSYSQDDWMRWGSADETRSSNFDGHELRFVYRFSNQIQLVFRNYVVDAIKRRSATSAAKEDGNRFRFDINYSF
ncbi:MAG: putative porin [Planctomycetota bacterium]|jgi:hypothetical protein|nr:putative porin [Planctomycetota bacterium]